MHKHGVIRTSNPGNRERIFNMEGEDPNENRARTTKGGNRPRRQMQNDGAMAASS